jgi:hypothetical protein
MLLKGRGIGENPGWVIALHELAIQVLHGKTVAAAIVDRYLDSCPPAIGAKR